MIKKRHPEWIKGKISFGENTKETKSVLTRYAVNTVCDHAACPNKGECWDKKHVTFMILGENCTRNCSFCNVTKKRPEVPDRSEPSRIAKTVEKLGIKYAVITSVTRDDLKDKGTKHFVDTVQAVKKKSPEVLIELLIPDMNADENLLREIAASGADVIGHNIEIPERFYTKVRPGSDYRRSIAAITILKKNSKDIPVKSSMIIGIGENKKDIVRTMKELKRAGVDILYIGQYLSPTGQHWPVKKYYTPQEFSDLGEIARDAGFRAVLSGPMVRSSYDAYASYNLIKK